MNFHLFFFNKKMMNLKQELLSKMTDEELVQTINSYKSFVNSSGSDIDTFKIGIQLLINEASKRTTSTNKDLIDFQDYIVNRFLKNLENE